MQGIRPPHIKKEPAFKCPHLSSTIFSQEGAIIFPRLVIVASSVHAIASADLLFSFSMNEINIQQVIAS